METYKMQTINYINLSPKTDINQLKSHIRYITRKSANPYIAISNIETWEERARYEKSKRHDARIALSVVIALPNDRKDDIQFFEKVKEFLAKILEVPTHHIDYVVHRDNLENIHMHAIVYPRKINMKKIHLSISDIKKIHKANEEFLREHGYEVVYLPEDQKTGHIGYKRREEIEMYKEKQRIKKEIEMLEKMMNEKVEEQDKKEEQIQVKQEDTKEAKKEQDKTITEAFNKVFDTLNKLTNNISQLKQTQMQKEQEIQQPIPKIQPQKQQQIQQQAQTQTVSKPIQQQAQLSQLSKGKEEEYDIQLLLSYWRDVEAYMKDKSREEREKYFIITALQEMKFKEELLLRAVMIIKQIDNATAEALIKRYIDTQEKSTSSNFNMDFSMEV